MMAMTTNNSTSVNALRTFRFEKEDNIGITALGRINANKEVLMPTEGLNTNASLRNGSNGQQLSDGSLGPYVPNMMDLVKS